MTNDKLRIDTALVDEGNDLQDYQERHYAQNSHTKESGKNCHNDPHY